MSDSPDAYFIGREAPLNRFEPTLLAIPAIGNPASLVGTALKPLKPFRDNLDRLAEQGARFRIFCYHYPQVGNRKDKEPSRGANLAAMTMRDVAVGEGPSGGRALGGRGGLR